MSAPSKRFLKTIGAVLYGLVAGCAATVGVVLVRDVRLINGMRRPVSSGMRYAPNERRVQGAKRRPAMKKISAMVIEGMQIFKENQLTIGLGLGDRTSHYCMLDEAGPVI